MIASTLSLRAEGISGKQTETNVFLLWGAMERKQERDSEKVCEVAMNEVASMGDITGDHLVKLLG